MAASLPNTWQQACVEAGANRRTAHGQIVKGLLAEGDGMFGMIELGDPAGHLLARGQRRGVPRLGATYANIRTGSNSGGAASRGWVRPDLRMSAKAANFSAKAVRHTPQGWQQSLAHACHRCQMHGAGKNVVGGLAHFHVVIGVYQAIASRFAA